MSQQSDLQMACAMLVRVLHQRTPYQIDRLLVLSASRRDTGQLEVRSTLPGIAPYRLVEGIERFVVPPQHAEGESEIVVGQSVDMMTRGSPDRTVCKAGRRAEVPHPPPATRRGATWDLISYFHVPD